mmetsp:Transcript_35126/g.78178  ORF Transcript_35126/g.78178 Transcript_35126/m.78178 type:complete len:206 (+) Transcript_35126:571-1188(+)
MLLGHSTLRYTATQGCRMQFMHNLHLRLGKHHVDKLLVVDLTITINIGLADHLLHLFLGELLAQVGHHMPQLSSRDEAVSILIEHFESLPQLLLLISFLHLACHKSKEFREVNGAVAISINLIDHVLQFCLSWVLPKGTHHRPKLLCCNCSICILVEERESFLELGNLLLCELVRACGASLHTGATSIATFVTASLSRHGECFGL